ncbi:MAG: glycoside hydrolase family 127 protein [Verrucomicrobiae bacterium]|nr:glycoside hydrolase family 127 protein [Verrucomicrobiae bacterium]
MQPDPRCGISVVGQAIVLTGKSGVDRLSEKSERPFMSRLSIQKMIAIRAAPRPALVQVRGSRKSMFFGVFALVTAVTFCSAVDIARASRSIVGLRPVPFTQVRISDRFWAPRRETNRLVSIPVNFANLEKYGNLENLRLAARKATSGYRGPVFMDSDVYKALEAAAYSLATDPDPALERQVDEIIAILGAAQQPDGYLNSYFTVKEPTQRWKNLRDWHELYCAGHLFEAAVAHYQATGKRTLLDIAVRLADHIANTFGPGRRMGYPGHPEIELALVKLARVTGEQKYFNLAKFFIENRGRKFFAEEHGTPLDKYDGTYWQDDVPITEHRNIKGHAVRACYLMSGATDVAAQTGDPALLRMLDRVWRNTVERNMYITGGIGPSASNEGFTTDYDLPNLTAYQETCASIALVLWNHRLALLYGDSRYVDVLERSLYNAVLAGVSLDGTRFFYVNPLESRGNHHRSEWFGCACCPPNVARILASLGGYAYAVSDTGLWVNLYIAGEVKVRLAGQDVSVVVETDYPWDGKVRLIPRVGEAAEFELRLRVPGWCEGAAVSVNDQPVSAPKIVRGYIVLSRVWRTGDSVSLDMPMPVQRIVAHPRVRDDVGMVALQRGPIVYCIEACDYSVPVSSLYLAPDADIHAEHESELLGGVTVIKGTALVAEKLNWRGKLYQPFPAGRRVPFKAIPYYAWDNRSAGAMKVWLPMSPPSPVAVGLESEAQVSMSFVSGNCHPEAINDGVEPKGSRVHPGRLCHWWPHKGSTEWVQYTWKEPVTVQGAEVYWFDDTGAGECRLPASWEVLYFENNEWKPVKNLGDYPVKLDEWCTVNFAPVRTTALRLQIQLKPQWAAGVHEWRVVEADEE